MPSAASVPRPGPAVRPPGDAQLILVSLAVAGAAAAIPRAGRHLAGPVAAAARSAAAPRTARNGSSPATRCRRRCSRHSTRPGADTCRAHCGTAHMPAFPPLAGTRLSGVPQPGMPGRRDDHPRCRIPADLGQESQIQARGKPGGTPPGHRPGQHAREHRAAGRRPSGRDRGEDRRAHRVTAGPVRGLGTRCTASRSRAGSGCT